MAHAPINGSTLAWARNLGRVDVEALAKAAGVKPERIDEFEDGSSMPTFRQLGLIATKLDRPLGFFFAPPPATSDMPKTADFRGRSHTELPADLAREMRRAEQHREVMLNLASPLTSQLPHTPITWANARNRATELRRTLGLTESFIPPETQPNQVFNFWRGLLEERGILVFQTTKIALSVFRGLSVHHDVLPIILINGSDSSTGRTFTLFHEMAHLFNRTSGVCVLQDSVAEEAIANNFAANFLMPETEVRNHLSHDTSPEDAAHDLAKTFKVSSLAAAVRLKTLGFIDEEELSRIRQKSNEEWDRARQSQKSKDGFVPSWRLRYRDLGPTYIGVVAKALEDNQVDLLDATYLFNTRLPTVEQLLAEYYRAGNSQ